MLEADGGQKGRAIEGVEVEGKYIRIGRFNADTRREFYAKTGQLAQIVCEEEYFRIFENAGIRDPEGWIMVRSVIKPIRNSFFDPRILGKQIKVVLFLVNGDRYKEVEETVMQAGIRHEQAELWMLGKISSPSNYETSLEIAHRYARMEQFRYAIEHGFIDQEIQYLRDVRPHDLEVSERIYSRAVKRFAVNNN